MMYLNWTRATNQKADKQYEDDLLEKHHSLDDEEDDIFDPQQESRLAGDYGSPAAPADDIDLPKIPNTHPETDTTIDQAELYDEGLTGASGIDDQEEGNTSRKNK
jgi:hypothetical protein